MLLAWTLLLAPGAWASLAAGHTLARWAQAGTSTSLAAVLGWGLGVLVVVAYALLTTWALRTVTRPVGPHLRRLP